MVRVGAGCSVRALPLCGLPLGLLDASPDPFCPRLGGRLELDGVFGGKPSFASSSAMRFVSDAIISACAKISASFAAASRELKSSGVFTPPLIQIRRSGGTPISPTESTRHRVSNYDD